MIKALLRRQAVAQVAVLMVGCVVGGCRREETSRRTDGKHTNDLVALGAEGKPVTPGPCDLIRVPHVGTGRLDLEIKRMQAKLTTEPNTFPYEERLGWFFVAKARESFDPGFYKLAEQCALCMELQHPAAPEALLLRGHVLQNLHRFKEAEVLARELVGRRGLAFDYGLLGDVLMEQGGLSEAAAAYQKMVDQKPDLQAYARIAHLRWLTGDVDGAAKILQLAVGAASPNSPEPAAWINTRLGLLEFQRGNPAAAERACSVALDYQQDYPPALLLRGRLRLAAGRSAEAIEALERAERLNPLPEYQWTLSEALRAENRTEQAETVETTLRKQGAAADPRTLALFLAGRGEMVATSLGLARDELKTRGDVFTHDALAWSLTANGRIDEARSEMKLALSEGTKDARIFLHAGVIAAKAGDQKEARLWAEKTQRLLPLLLPSEQAQWRGLAAQLGIAEPVGARSESTNTTIFTSEN